MTVVKRNVTGRQWVDWTIPFTAPNTLLAATYYAYGRELGGWLPTAALVRLLGEVDVGERAARSALHRRTRGGLLARENVGRAPGYRLTPAWIQIMDQEEQLFQGLRSDPPSLDEGWVIVTFTIPETRRDERHLLRSVLTRMSFGNLCPGVWIAPARRWEVTQRRIDGIGLTHYTHAFRGTYEQHENGLAFVAQSWDLPGLEAGFGQFVSRFKPALNRGRSGNLENRAAFVEYTIARLVYRRVALGDPGLPTEVLPPRSNVLEARRILDEMWDVVRPGALEYVTTVAGLGGRQFRE